MSGSVQSGGTALSPALGAQYVRLETLETGYKCFLGRISSLMVPVVSPWRKQKAHLAIEAGSILQFSCTRNFYPQEFSCLFLNLFKTHRG